MASNIGYKQFPEFDVRNDPETVYARFIKYAKRFKNNHLKAYNITDEDQQRSLFLDSIGEATLDKFEQLDNTGTDLDGAITALRNKFKESHTESRHYISPRDALEMQPNLTHSSVRSDIVHGLYLRIANICPSIALDVIFTNIFILSSWFSYFSLLCCYLLRCCTIST